jgi:outer membrane immunogenic protein
MRAKLIGAALAALIAPMAFAGELPGKGSIAAPITTAQAEDSWNRTGFYAVAIGAYDTAVLEAEGFDLASGKLMAGAALGWNWRAGGVVLGMEADWIFTGISASGGDEEVAIRASTDHLVSVRARAGIPLGPALIYATAGPAWQHAKLTVGDASERTWHLGLAVGGGAEVELTRSFALRLEALHYAFPNDGAPLNEILDSENQHTTVRAGAVLKF